MSAQTPSVFEDVKVALLPVESTAVIPSVVLADPATVFPQMVIIEEVDDTLNSLIQRIIADSNLGSLGLDAVTDCEIYYQVSNPLPRNNGLSFAIVPPLSINRRLHRTIIDAENPTLYFVYYIGKAKDRHRVDGLSKASYLARGLTQKPPSAKRTPSRDTEPREPNRPTTPRTPNSQTQRSNSTSHLSSTASMTTTPSPRGGQASPTMQKQRQHNVRRPDVFVFTGADDDHEADRRLFDKVQQSSQTRDRQRSSSPLLEKSLSPDRDEIDARKATTMGQKNTTTPRPSQPTNEHASRRSSTSSLPLAAGEKRRRSRSTSPDDVLREYPKNTFPVKIAGDTESFLRLLCRSEPKLQGRVHVGTLRRHFAREKLANHKAWIDLNPWVLNKDADSSQSNEPGSSQSAVNIDDDDGADSHARDASATAGELANKASKLQDGPVASEARR